MSRMQGEGWSILALGVAVSISTAPPASAQTPTMRSTADVVAAAPSEAWSALDPENTLYLQIDQNWVVIELAPDFAPEHVEKIRRLAREGFWTNGGVVRSQDNYVAQWQIRDRAPGDPDWVRAPIAPEFERDLADGDLATLPDPDTWADQVGFVDGMPVARDSDAGMAWIAHCYGAVGVARGNDPGSGGATQLYAVTGHAPRHLDRNLTMVGRVIWGMEHLTSLPRGTGNLGFYQGEERVPVIRTGVLGSDMAPENRLRVEVMRTDSESFSEYIAAARHRGGPFFVHDPGRVDLCNVRVPVRPVASEVTPAVTDLETEVREFLEGYSAAFSDRDREAVRSAFVADGRVRWVEDGTVQYRSVDEVLVALSRLPPDMPFETRYDDLSVLPLTADEVWAESAFTTTLGSGEQAYTFSGRVTLLLERGAEGGWRIIRGHTSTLRPEGWDDGGDPSAR